MTFNVERIDHVVLRVRDLIDPQAQVAADGRDLVLPYALDGRSERLPLGFGDLSPAVGLPQALTALEEHDAVYRAVARGDEDAAASAMAVHMATASQRLSTETAG